MIERFWERKTLAELDEDEWEALCDGCGRCCLLKLEDEDTGEVLTTSVVCRLFDHATCRCTRYPERNEVVEDCIEIDAKTIGELGWLPETCAYRMLGEGRPLESWHPLIAGNDDAIKEAGISVHGNVIDETAVHPDELVLHVLRWV